MIQRKKGKKSPDEERASDSPPADDATSKKPDPSLSNLPTRRIMLGMAVVAAGLVILSRVLSKLDFLRVVTLSPLAMCVYAVWQAHSLERRLLPATMVGVVIGGQLPVAWSAAIAAASIVAFGLAMVPRGERLKRPPASLSATVVVGAVLILAAVMLGENFMIWVVSATFPEGQNPQTAPSPLQDNGQILLQLVLSGLSKRQVVALRRLWNVQWALVGGLAASFVHLEVYQHPRRQLFAVGVRAVVCLAGARLIRTVSFLLTVVPSQSPRCYLEHFPPPPAEWWEWVQVGFRPAAHGGCNDLIISGHATVTATLASVVSSVSGDRWFQTALWSMLVLDYCIEIYEGFHYSVDMWLGMIVVSLLWRVLQPLEGPATTSTVAASTTYKVPLHRADVVAHAIPAAIAYLQVTIGSQATANPLIVLYVVATGVLYFGFAAQSGNEADHRLYLHYAQHTLFCVLLIALATYL